MEGGDDGGRGSGADIRSRRDRGAVDVDAKDPCACQAERAVDEYPDECTEQKSGCLAETFDGRAGTHAGNEYVDHRRADGRGVRQA